MFCPVCNSQNDSMAVRCLKCGQVLIHEATGHSKEYLEAVRLGDSRMYGGYGAIIGGGLGLLFCALVPEVSGSAKAIVVCATGAGAGIGKYLAWKNWQDLS